MNDLLIKNGVVVFEHDVYPADLLIRDGKIEAIFQPGTAPEENVRILDASGLHIMPGSIDPHTHWGIYKKYEEDVVEDSKRAVIGGLTTVLQFHRHNYDYFDTVPDYIRFCEQNSMVDFTFSLGLVKKAHVADLERYVKELKITSFKFYLDKTNGLAEFLNFENKNQAPQDFVMPDIVKYEDEYYKYFFYDYDYTKAPIYLWPFTPNVLSTGGFTNGYGFAQE